ncbi:MAG TPA: FAD-binding oxidoreductase [Polyangia bacterium]
MSGSVHEATVIGINSLAREVVEWVLRTDPPEPLRFRPGQFISLRIGEDADGAAILRSYSIASSPGQPELSLILKLVDGGAASSWFRKLALGDRVRFTGPMGFFCLDLEHAGDVVLGATGVGITPVLPMIDELLARPNEHGRVRLYWGNRSPEDLFWQEELAARVRAHDRLEVRTYVTAEAPGWSGLRGRITPAVLADLGELSRPVFYLVGNGAMIRELKGELVSRGVDRKRQIRNEAFFE